MENEKLVNLWNNGLAQAINNKSVVVGSQNVYAVIWERGEIKDLMDLVINGRSDLIMARDINDIGEIVGQGRYNGKDTDFLLIPYDLEKSAPK